jgi:hypothetical protein
VAVSQEGEAARLRNALAWVRHVAGLHYLGGAFEPEHMRDLANLATAALQGKELPDYEEAMEEGRQKAEQWAHLFATWADGAEDEEDERLDGQAECEDGSVQAERADAQADI